MDNEIDLDEVREVPRGNPVDDYYCEDCYDYGCSLCDPLWDKYCDDEYFYPEEY